MAFAHCGGLPPDATIADALTRRTWRRALLAGPRRLLFPLRDVAVVPRDCGVIHAAKATAALQGSEQHRGPDRHKGQAGD